MKDDLKNLSMKSIQCLESCQEEVKQVSKFLKDHEHLFILGKGPGEAIAKEGALKIKEVTYIHAEGYASGEFKHGPMAMIDSLKGTPCKSLFLTLIVILIILNDEYFDNMIHALNQVKGRNATTFVITDCANKIDSRLVDKFIHIPSCGMLTPLLSVLPIQLITYETAIMKGVDPDRPRHLAKEITVQ
jgi:glucosamine--fructose-6-phosphate aminotransferase (isomerizing)